MVIAVRTQFQTTFTKGKTMSYEERRKFPRIDTSIKVNFDNGMESFTEFTLNLSLGGLYIKTIRPLAMDSVITVDFKLPGFEHTFSINGKIVWRKTEGTGEEPPGMGIEFMDLSSEDKQILIQYVARSQLTRKGC